MDRETQTGFSIGIGVTTTINRKEYVDRWLLEFEKVKPKNYHLHIHEDVHYKGVAYSKNQNLKTLQDCDYIFLFDDDCYVTKEGWAEYFINSKQHHLLFLNKSHNKLASHGEVEYFTDCGGVFMFLTKEVLNKVGAFDETYGKYAFEHVDYSNRILGKKNNYPMLKDTNKYLRALDYEGINNSSISNNEKQYWIKKNWNKYFNEEIKSIYLPL